MFIDELSFHGLTVQERVKIDFFESEYGPLDQETIGDLLGISDSDFRQHLLEIEDEAIED